MRALETFTQLLERDPESGVPYFKYSSATVSDNSRFTHRYSNNIFYISCVLYYVQSHTLSDTIIYFVVIYVNLPYQCRGVMIDTSRHYLPTDQIYRIIDLLPMSKFNVLHIHLVDAQSFPFDSMSSPDIAKGAYSKSATYSVKDIQAISDYAIDRAVRVIFEIDVPGM